MPDRKQDTQNLCIALVMLASAGYATLRYNICQGVPWADWATWTLNKAFAIGSLALLLVAVIRRRSNPNASYAKVLSTSVGMAALHVVLSLMLMTPDYYAKFFTDGKLTGSAGWSMFFGVIAAVIMTRRGRGADRKPMLEKPLAHESESGMTKGLWMVVVVAVLVAIHTLLQGWSGWFDWGKWPGGLPPITLISFVLGASALFVTAWPSKNQPSK